MPWSEKFIINFIWHKWSCISTQIIAKFDNFNYIANCFAYL